MSRELRLRFWFISLIGVNLLLSLLLLISTASEIPNIQHSVDNCLEVSSKSLRCELYKRLSELTDSRVDSALSLYLGIIGIVLIYLISSAWALVGAAYHSHRSLLPFILLSVIMIPSISAAATLIIGSGGSVFDIVYISGFSLLYIVTLCVAIIYYSARETALRESIPYNRFSVKF